MPYFIQEREDKYCVVKGTKAEPGEVEKCYDEEEKAKELMKALYANSHEGKAINEEEPVNKFFSYKAADDTWRWTSISSVAIVDKESEIVSEKAYDDAIKYALESNKFGELDVVHIDGTEVGDCDMMIRLGFQLIESGTWRNTDKARMVRTKVAEDPDNWGVSIQFHFDPKQFDGITYKGGIQITKRAVLPRSMAASFGTAIAITGGMEMKGKMTDEAKAVLLGLGWTEGDLITLAEKSMEDDNPNVKNKTEDVEEKVEEVAEEIVEETSDPIPQSFRDKAMGFFAELFGEPQATQSDVENKTEDPTKTSVEEKVEEIKVEEKVEDKVEEEKVEEIKVEGDNTKAVMTALFTTMAEETSKAIQKSITPLQESLIALEARLLESEKSVEEKVLTRLASLPPVVKVQPTFAAPITNVPVQGEVVDGKESQTKVFVDSVTDLIAKGFANGGSLPKFDL